MKVVQLAYCVVAGGSGLLWAAGVPARDAPGAPPALGDSASVRTYPVPEINVSPPEELPDPNAPSLFSVGDRGFGVVPAWHLSHSRASPEWPLLGQRDMFARPAARGAPASIGGWTMGAENWRYGDPSGVELTVGNDWSGAPAWSAPARLGGIRLSRSRAAGSADQDPWQYSLMVGALDYSTDSTSGHDLQYGPAASSAVVQYSVNRGLTVASQLEWAPDLLAAGVGARYAAPGWGSWVAGIAKARQGLYEGYRYQTGYQVGVMDDLKLSWAGVWRTSGFSDLTSYRDFSAGPGGSASNQWTATLSMGRWGSLTGGVESTRTGTGDLQQSFGVSQQFWYSPNLRVEMKAAREMESGDYTVGLNFSVPIF